MLHRYSIWSEEYTIPLGGLLGGIPMIATGESVKPLFVDDRCIFLIQEEGGFGIIEAPNQDNAQCHESLWYTISCGKKDKTT